MRLRTDSSILAGYARTRELGVGAERFAQWPAETLADLDAIEPAKIGDVWRAHYPSGGQDHHVGYALTCPNEQCADGVHHWTWAGNCSERVSGDEHRRCQHQLDGVSCWAWTGSAEDSTLTAHPSLHSVVGRGGCGWHGWLRNGEMVV